MDNNFGELIKDLQTLGVNNSEIKVRKEFREDIINQAVKIVLNKNHHARNKIMVRLLRSKQEGSTWYWLSLPGFWRMNYES